MKKAFTFIVIFLVLVASLPFNDARAQSITPSVVDTTTPVDAGVRTAVEAWLGLSAPVPLPYWAITYVETRGDDTLVSIAALNIASPSDPWRMVDSDTVSWIGTVIIRADQSVEMYSTEPEPEAAYNPFKIAMPVLPAPGGGSYLRFPWKSGSTMMYGPRGVHAAGGGGAYATGFVAVDFVGGDDMGSGVAPSNAYAVSSGVVDYVCADDTTTLVRTHNSSADDYFIYAHLLDNANLVMDHSFGSGLLLGSLKYGSFDDNCGWAEQQDDHYHLHFGFETANNAMRLEGCILNTTNQKWTCGTQTISTGQFLIGGGGVGSGTGTGTGTGDDGTGASVAQPSFWDYVVIGVVSIWDKTVVQNMPSHTTLQYTYVIYSSAKLAIRMARVLVHSNVNLGPLIMVILFGMGIRVIFGIAEFIVFLFKAWKSLVPILGA